MFCRSAETFFGRRKCFAGLRGLFSDGENVSQVCEDFFRAAQKACIPAETSFGGQNLVGDVLRLNEGTVYTALLRLQQKRWISAEWGASENNRRAKYYSITKTGRKQLAEDAAYWYRLSSVMGRVLSTQEEGAER